MKKLILMMTLMTSLSSFADYETFKIDNLVLCETADDIITAQRKLNTKISIPLYMGEVYKTPKTNKMVLVKDYEMTAPTMAIHPNGEVLLCVSLNKKK